MKNILQVTVMKLCGVGMMYSPVHGGARGGEIDVVQVDVTRTAPGV